MVYEGWKYAKVYLGLAQVINQFLSATEAYTTLAIYIYQFLLG